MCYSGKGLLLLPITKAKHFNIIITDIPKSQGRILYMKQDRDIIPLREYMLERLGS